MQIVQRHHFASYLKRMAVVVRVQEEFLAFVKVLLFIIIIILYIIFGEYSSYDCMRHF